MCPQRGVIDLPSKQINDFSQNRNQIKIELVPRPEVGDDFKGGGSGATWGPLPTLTTFTPGGPESAVPTEDPLFSGPPIGDPFLMDFRCSRQYSVVRLELERKSCIVGQVKFPNFLNTAPKII